ncbi:hypothetical protein AB4239_22620, partial [Vibrio sp. 10N.286.45.C10]|uniref:hypothetical protein n=1 Tax=Vibrio TaxID=662 RepID=UPI00354CF95E
LARRAYYFQQLAASSTPSRKCYIEKFFDGDYVSVAVAPMPFSGSSPILFSRVRLPITSMSLS